MGSLYGGFAANREAQRQAKTTLQQAAIEAQQVAKEDAQFRGRMEVSFLKSGVTLEGTPLLVLEQARKDSMEDIKNLKKGAQLRASSIRRQGRDAMIQGVLGAGETAARLYMGAM